MNLKKLTLVPATAALIASFSASALAEKHCKVTSAQGWGITEELAKSQAHSMLLLATGNIITQQDKFSKPKDECKLTLLGWSCKTTAKVCKK